ncbi:MAG TPA: LptE family protein [Desulfuromonadales bacterium]|nr:LptE family protein [Desulfuromonadales bacterium]
MRTFGLLLAALLLLGGCGYHLSGRSSNLPSDVQSLYIELFSNRTTEPFLENSITDSVIARFARNRPLRLVEKRDSADAVLSGVVTAYGTSPISYDRNDVITEYRSTLTIAVTLRQASDDRILWKGSIDWSEEYPANLDKGVQEDNEAVAIAVIADRLAQELYFRIMENF